MKTWMADYASVEEIYWPVPGDTVDADKLPGRAFDSEAQRQQTEELLADYNQVLHVTPELDARFAALAGQRIRHAPLRYYVWLPLLRIADMWLRPRTETLPSDTRWWEFNDDPKWSALAVALGIIGLVYVGMAAAGLAKAREITFFGLLLAFLVLRSVFLGTLENPEPRYTLECYPVVIILAAAFLAKTDKTAELTVVSLQSLVFRPTEIRILSAPNRCQPVVLNAFTSGRLIATISPTAICNKSLHLLLRANVRSVEIPIEGCFHETKPGCIAWFDALLLAALLLASSAFTPPKSPPRSWEPYGTLRERSCPGPPFR